MIEFLPPYTLQHLYELCLSLLGVILVDFKLCEMDLIFIMVEFFKIIPHPLLSNILQ